MSLVSLQVGQTVRKGGALHVVAAKAMADGGVDLSAFCADDKAYAEKAVDGIWLLLFLKPTDAETLAVLGGEPASELHLTVGAIDPASAVGKQDIINAIIKQAASSLPPVRGKIGGIGQFLTDAENVPVVALFDSPELNAWRDALLGTLKAVGVELLSDHGYTPHITLVYADEGVELPDVQEMEIELPVLSLVWEGERRDFQLTGADEDIKGGKGSGNFGHGGRPGKVGGSSPSSASTGRGMAHALAEPTRMSEKGTLGLLEDGIVPGSGGTSLRDRLFPNNPQRASAAMRDGQNRAKVKGEIISTIAEQTGINPDKVSGVLKTWAETSKATPEAIELQRAAAEEFGLPVPEMEPLLESSGKIPQVDRQEMRSILRAMYNETQRRFQEKGIDSIILYRGVKRDAGFPGRAGDVISYRGNPIQSWSALWDVAFTFGDSRGARQDGIVLVTRVPVGLVISTARTGLGCLGEYEFVVLGDDMGNEAMIISQSDAGSKIWEHADE